MERFALRKNVAVILAGGMGNRFGLDIPKQFVKLAGKTIIEHTIEVFSEHKNINEICIVIKKDWKNRIEEIVAKNKFSKVKKIIFGGEERRDSSLSAILSYENEKEINLIFHDAVRPFVDNRIIDDIIESLQYCNAVDVAIPSTDTIIEVKDGFITSIPQRQFMMQGQTPQAFKLETIRRAYLIADKDSDFVSTDDCGIVKKYLPDEKIHVVMGSLENIKITYPCDISIADKIFQLRNIRNDFIHSEKYYQENLKDKVVVVFGGASGIGLNIVNLTKLYGAKVEVFSRTATNTNIALLSDVERDLDSVYQKYGSIDFVVNTASILIKSHLEFMSYGDILDTININYLGAINVAKASLPYLEKTSGQLLNFASSSYTRGRSGYSLYSSSKAAIVNLTQALAEEFKSVNQVRVNCISPQRTLTPMRTANFGKENPDTLLDPKDVAYVAINTLLSDFTGQIVEVNLEK